MGVWIETLTNLLMVASSWVTPFVGVWIETPKMMMTQEIYVSHPSWVCGLKPKVDEFAKGFVRHTLRGCVD